MDRFPSRERSAAVALQPRVSAIVVTHHTGRSLELCLRSALAEPWIDELIIVDAGNPPEVSSALRALQADRRDVKLVSAGDVSAAAAANLGAAKARGRCLLFLDPHVIVQRGAAARMAAAGDAAREPWIVGGRLTDTTGRDRRAARAGVLNVWSALAVAMELPGARLAKRPKSRAIDAVAAPAAVGAVSGAFMLIPRSHFMALGGFDEGFVSDAADLDLCRRAGEAGGAVLFEPGASGIQFAGRTFPRRQAQGLARFAAKSARTPLERVFAAGAGPTLALVLALRDFIGGRPPPQRK